MVEKEKMNVGIIEEKFMKSLHDELEKMNVGIWATEVKGEEKTKESISIEIKAKEIKECLDHYKEHEKKHQELETNIRTLETVTKCLAATHDLKILHCNACGAKILESMPKCPACGRKWERPERFTELLKNVFWKAFGEVAMFVFTIGFIFSLILTSVFSSNDIAEPGFWAWCIIPLVAACFGITLFILIIGFMVDDNPGHVKVTIGEFQEYLEKVELKKQKHERQLQKLEKKKARIDAEYERL